MQFDARKTLIALEFRRIRPIYQVCTGARNNMITRRAIGIAALVLALVCPAIPQIKPASSTKTPTPRITLEQAGSRTGRDRVPAFEGKDVLVAGEVSTRPIWITDSFYVAIQDDALFGLVLRPEIPQLPDLTPGDWVEAQGTISNRAGLPILVPRTIRRLRHLAPPVPKAVTASDLASFRYMGVLVTLESIITGENQNGGGDLLSDRPAQQRTERVPAPNAAG